MVYETTALQQNTTSKQRDLVLHVSPEKGLFLGEYKKGCKIFTVNQPITEVE
jgi:hypothetical protein